MPTAQPRRLVPQLLASPLIEYNGTFSADGRTFYYTTEVPGRGVIVVTSMQADGTWSPPTVAPFSGKFSDYDPLFSPDGQTLYFSSQRPVPGAPADRSHNWAMTRTKMGWSVPRRLRLTEQGDYYASVTRTGHVYFNVWSTGDLYRAMPTPEGYDVKKLDDVINRRGDIGDPFISPDEDYLIFRGYGEDSLGQGDLYISFRTSTGWTPPHNLGRPINSEAHELCPYVTPDGKLFIFASRRLETDYSMTPGRGLEAMHQKSRTADNGQTNIYYMSADFILELKQTYLSTAQPGAR